MATILIVYSTVDGHTFNICRRLQQAIEQQAHQVTLVSASNAPDRDVDLFDKIVIGASIRYGKHRPQVYEFIKRNQKVLESRPSAFFSVNVVARKPGKNRPDTNPYIRQFQRRTSWHPKELAVFAGRIDYQKYRFWDRYLIRLIMWMTDGPTDPQTATEFTNWSDVDVFAQRVCAM
jgi:menaquinone-dependent protoporphyrinogen oxidase